MSASRSILQYSAPMGGKHIDLSVYSGYGILIVNTASMCSFAPSNMQQLVHLQQKYNSQKFNILAFPCPQFARQEPKSNDAIETWAKEWQANFKFFDKINVKGNNALPLFQMLQDALGPIKWNYTKFICSREGVPLVQLPPTASTTDLEHAIERYQWYPKKVVRGMSKRTIARRSQVGAFLRVVNHKHFLPTRYNMDLSKELRGRINVSDAPKKTKSKRLVNKLFQARYNAGSNRWFFQRLRF